MGRCQNSIEQPEHKCFWLQLCLVWVLGSVSSRTASRMLSKNTVLASAVSVPWHTVFGGRARHRAGCKAGTIVTQQNCYVTQLPCSHWLYHWTPQLLDTASLKHPQLCMPVIDFTRVARHRWTHVEERHASGRLASGLQCADRLSNRPDTYGHWPHFTQVFSSQSRDPKKLQGGPQRGPGTGAGKISTSTCLPSYLKETWTRPHGGLLHPLRIFLQYLQET